MTHPTPPTIERLVDVAVIGGSAAGLAAALQLARQRRTVAVVDDDTPRNAPAAHMHGYLGREGASPAQLREIGREEVRSYGGEVLAGRAVAVHPARDGRFRVDLTGGHRLHARRVVVATGIVDELPDVAGLAQRWGVDVLHCPFCHGWEVGHRRVVQLVTHPLALHQTPLLRHLGSRLAVVVAPVDGIDEARLEALGAAGVDVHHGTAARLRTTPSGGIAGVELVDGTELPADAVFVGSRFRARVEVLAGLGIGAVEHPTGLGDVLEVDQTGQTSHPGVYAAGNVVDPTMQVLQAAASGSRVGAMVAFSLAGEDLGDPDGRSGSEVDWDRRYAAPEHVWSANPNGTLVAEARTLAPGRALDVGAGEGADALWLAEHGWDVTVCDISANALRRIAEQADRRGLAVRTIRADVTTPGVFGPDTFDLVSLQYGSLHRTPEDHGTANLLGAVAAGGTLLVVGHDLAPLHAPHDPGTQTRMYDPQAYVGVRSIADVLRADPHWRVEVDETRPRPPGAASVHHVHDTVLRAVRRTGGAGV